MRGRAAVFACWHAGISWGGCRLGKKSPRARKKGRARDLLLARLASLRAGRTRSGSRSAAGRVQAQTADWCVCWLTGLFWPGGGRGGSVAEGWPCRERASATFLVTIMTPGEPQRAKRQAMRGFLIRQRRQEIKRWMTLAKGAYVVWYG